jgi:hypothetical protein
VNDQTAVVVAAPAAEVDLFRLGDVLAQSGYFQDARQAAQAIVKVMAGRELGFGPIASMTGIHIIQGRPAIGADLMAKAVKRSGRYNYRVTELTDEACSVEFFEKSAEAWQSIGTSRFTKADATKAKTKNLDAFPRNMLFARAMSNGVKWFCPDALGLTTYTPEELEGIEVAPIQAPAAPAAQPEPAISQTTFPDHGQPAELPRLTDWQRKALHAAGSAYYGKEWDNKRHELVLRVTKGRTQSSADLTPDEATRLIDGINRKANEDAAKMGFGMMAMAEDVDAGLDPRDGMPFGDK